MTKINLSIPDMLFVELGKSMLDVPPPDDSRTIDIEELMDFNGLCEAELDFDDILRTNRMIGQFWTTNDVASERPDLSDDEAWQVLQTIDTRWNAERPVSWEFIRDVADELFPEPDTFCGTITIQVSRRDIASRDAAIAEMQDAARAITNTAQGVEAELIDYSVRHDSGEPKLTEGDGQ